MQVYPFAPPQLPSGDTTSTVVGVGMAPLPDTAGLLEIIDGYAEPDMLELPQMPYSVWQPVSQ